jgi:DNA ligase D-like protein (predicted ligase)
MSHPLQPMLATWAAPFDSEEYSFEVKWDGVRALAAIADGRCQLLGRAGSDYTPRYPELAVLRRLPSGTVIDGEVIALTGGCANFRALLQRHQRNPRDDLHLPGPSIYYVVFDLLFAKGQSLLREPLRERRERLRELLGAVDGRRLIYSEGVVGCGRDFFREVVAQGHEGVVAKHLGSAYRPGQRSPAWKKIKQNLVLPCLIVGYRAERTRLRSVLVGSLREQVLRYVGEVSRGFTEQMRAELVQQLSARPRAFPVVPCPKPACWVEPGFYCRVRFQEWTSHGRLRHPMFDGCFAPFVPVPSNVRAEKSFRSARNPLELT